MPKRPMRTPRRPESSAAGRKIIGALTELAEAVERGGPLPPGFTARTVELPDPPAEYDAAAVRATRVRLGASQAVFAHLLAVSPKLVQAWEQGSRKPAGPERRLLDDINADPDRWVRRFNLVTATEVSGRIGFDESAERTTDRRRASAG